MCPQTNYQTVINSRGKGIQSRKRENGNSLLHVGMLGNDLKTLESMDIWVPCTEMLVLET